MKNIPFYTWYRFGSTWWYITSVPSQYSKKYIGFGYNSNLFLNYKLNPFQTQNVVLENPQYIDYREMIKKIFLELEFEKITSR